MWMQIVVRLEESYMPESVLANTTFEIFREKEK